MKKIFLYFFLLLCFNTQISAETCVEYKQKIKTIINQPEWKTTINQPDIFMEKYHGNVVATFIDTYDIGIEVIKVKDGLCVILKSIDSVIGYKDFEIKIDKTHKPNTCSYNIVLNHEKEHINAYLSLIKDNESYIQNAVYNSVNSIMPIFINSDKEIPNVIDKFNKEIQNHPDIILMKQKIHTEEEIRNKKIDLYDNKKLITECKTEKI